MLFAGSAADLKYINELNDLIVEYHLEENVEFLGNVENIEKLYKDVDILFYHLDMKVLD